MSLLLHDIELCFVNLQVIATLVVISYSTPIFIAVIVPIGIIYYFIQVWLVQFIKMQTVLVPTSE